MYYPTQALDSMPASGTLSRESWRSRAIHWLRSLSDEGAETPLIAMPLADAPGIRLYIKDESAHASGSLKHRLARSLLLHALCNGWIREDTVLYEASSGSTAVSLAWFAQRLGLEFVAVVPAATAVEKIAQIRQHGGACHTVDDPRLVQSEAARLARENGGHFIDQFTHAERASDWRGDDSLAAAIFREVHEREGCDPTWLVCGAGTGGTAATLGRFARYRGHDSRLCVADPEASVFHRHYRDRAVEVSEEPVSCVEGIGRPCMVPSFLPDVIDRMMTVADRDSFAATHRLSAVLGRPCGPSSGTNIHAALEIVREMREQGEAGVVVTLLCDGGDRYQSTFFNPDWAARKGFAESAMVARLQELLPVR